MVRYKLYEFVLSQVRKEFIVRVTKAIKAEQLALLEEHYFDAKPALENLALEADKEIKERKDIH